MGNVSALKPKPKPTHSQLPIPVPTGRFLKVMTKNVPLPEGVEFNQHDEFEVTLKVRIEKVVNDAPVDKFGNCKRSDVVTHAVVLAYSGDDFEHEVNPELVDDDDNGDDD